MRLSRSDLIPVLTVVAGGVIGASFSFGFRGPSEVDVVLVTPVVLHESDATQELPIRVQSRVGTVTGEVTDAQSGRSIAAAQIFIDDLRMGTLSQRTGRYSIQNVPTGEHTLTLARIGYRTVDVQIVVGRDQSVEQDFAISEEALPLDVIVVSRAPIDSQRRVVNVRRSPSISRDAVEPTYSRMVAVRSGPVFTPMSVRPEVTNLAEVQEALMTEYPSVLRDDGVGGQVVVWFFISKEGRVLDRRISQSSGHAGLDEAALEVAEVFRFTPAKNRDERVQVWVQLPIVFEVEN